MAAPDTKSRGEVRSCPACGAAIKLAAKASRVQCPSCREVVTLSAPPPPVVVPAERSRIDELEERVAKLERLLEEAVSGAAAASASKLKWLAGNVEPDFSHKRAEVLCHNLGTVSAHPITIQSTAGDDEARERAEWFKDVFERARWPVRGPEDAPPAATRRGLALATSLPVSPEAAATFMALRAAGFELATAYDPELGASEERLIVP